MIPLYVLVVSVVVARTAGALGVGAGGELGARDARRAYT